MDRYAVLNDKRVVVNVIIWDGISQWAPPESHTVERSDTANIGDTLD
jgi:hypothetical protein